MSRSSPQGGPPAHSRRDPPYGSVAASAIRMLHKAMLGLFAYLVLRRVASIGPVAVVVGGERFACEFALLAGSGGGLGSEVGVGGCEMTDTDEVEARHALFDGQLGESALRLITARKQLLAAMLLTRGAQILERRRPASGFGEAVAAVAERVRACRNPPIALVARRWLGRASCDRAHLGHRDLDPAVEDEAVRGAAGDPADLLGAIVKADRHPFVCAHRLQNPQDQLVG